MRARLCLSLVGFSHLCAAAAAQERPNTVPPPNVASSQIYITHVTVIDTVTGKEAKDRTVVISGERISEVRDSEEVRPPTDAKVVDAKGKYLIPGLWDMHTHALFQERVASMFPMFVGNGVLGIRDMGSPMNLADIDRLRKEVTTGSRLGPRIVAAGPILDGHEKPEHPNFIAITTAEQGREMVRSLKTGGADFVKVYSWLSRDSFLAITDEANKQNIPFAGHVPFSVSALEASDAGQKSMEHLRGIALACSAREEEIRNELVKGGTSVSHAALNHLEIEEAGASYSGKKAGRVFAHLAKNHTWQVPTFAADLPDSLSFDTRVTSDPRLRYIPLSVQGRWNKRATSVAGSSPWGKFHKQRLEMLGAMHRAGVPVLAGTDTSWILPYTYAGFSLHDELALLVRAGLTPIESLQTATINPARFLGLEKDLGSVEKGKIANLVLLDADPLADIHNTTKISVVFLAGKEFARPALDQMLKSAEAAAKSAVVQ